MGKVKRKEEGMGKVSRRDLLKTGAALAAAGALGGGGFAQELSLIHI